MSSPRKPRPRTKMTNGVMRRGATWSYTLYTPNLDADGKPLGGKGRTTWVGGFATKEAAQIAKREAQNSKDKGEAVEPIRQSLREYVEQSWLPAVAANVKPTSASSYRQSIAHALTVIGDKKIQRLTPTDVQGMVTKLLADGRTPRTVGKTLTVLRIAMKHAVTLRVIPRDPTTGIQKPLVETVRRRTMTMAEVAAIDAASRDTTWSAFVRLALYTGCRRGENLALTWKDCELDGDNPTITIRRNVVDVDGKRIEQTPKNGKEREVTIDTETVSILRAHKASQNAARLRLGSDWNALDLVTCLADGSPPMPHSATQAWSRLCKTAKIEHHNLHNARHTHATTLLEADVPLHVVADRLGHLDAMVTATIYAHVTTARRASTAEVFAAAVDTATAAR